MKNILTIIKKELKTNFNHPTAYILMVVFLAISYFFYFKPALISGQTTLRPLFDILPWILIFFVPAVSMGLIAKEKNDGTIEILATQPIKPIEIIIGKALGAFLFVCINLLITLSIPLSLAKFGDFDWGLTLSQYIGSFFLVASLVSIGVWASSITKNQIISFISSIALNFFLVFAGFEMVTLSLPYPLNIIFKKISILDHFYNIARGVIDLRDVIYFTCLILIFLFASYLAFLKIKGGKTKKYKKFSNLVVGLVVLALIVNLSGDFIKGRVDLTQGRIFTLSSATKDIISNLDNQLTISLFVSKKLPAQIENQAQDVKDLLADYVANSNGKIKLNIYHPDSSQQAKSLAQQKGIPPVQFNVISKDEFQARQGYLGLVIEKEENQTQTPTDQDNQGQLAKKSESIRFIERTDNLEYQLTSFIWKLVKAKNKKIAWLEGHGEKNLWQDFSSANQELGKQYQLDALNLKQTNEKNKQITFRDIPQDISLLIIAGPNQKMEQAELKKINNYLNQGGSALIMTNQIAINPQFMTATSTSSNINSLLNVWGINVSKSIVYDLKSNTNVTLRNGVMSYVLPYPMWVRALGGPGNTVLGDVKSIVLPWPSAIKILKDKLENNTKITELFGTTEFAGQQQGPFNISPQGNLSQNNLNRRLLAVAVENNIDSHLSRLIIIGNSDFASEQFLPNSPENLVFLLNAIEWLSQDEILTSIRTKGLARAPLAFTSDRQKNYIKYLNIIGVPFMVIMAGAWILWRRKKISLKKFQS